MQFLRLSSGRYVNLALITEAWPTAGGDLECRFTGDEGPKEHTYRGQDARELDDALNGLAITDRPRAAGASAAAGAAGAPANPGT